MFQVHLIDTCQTKNVSGPFYLFLQLYGARRIIFHITWLRFVVTSCCVSLLPEWAYCKPLIWAAFKQNHCYPVMTKYWLIINTIFFCHPLFPAHHVPSSSVPDSFVCQTSVHHSLLTAFPGSMVFVVVLFFNFFERVIHCNIVTANLNCPFF